MALSAFRRIICMELSQQLDKNIRAALLSIERFFELSDNETNKIKVSYYLAAQKLNEVMEDIDILFSVLSERISACDSLDGECELDFLEDILLRTTELRKICEAFLSDCESALASGTNISRRIRMSADTALRKIKLI